MKNLLVSLEKAGDFDEIIDVRTPLEFAEDHIPGAINAPVLSNEERVLVGTTYKQVSPFEGTRIGAALVARNIAHHLETTFADRPRNWRPLIYCWRGGKRSGSVTTLFNMIGWQARQLDGGYKSYRRATLESLETLPKTFSYIALVGPTGSGKTRLLSALEPGGRADARPRSARRASRLAARRMGGRAAAVAKAFRYRCSSARCASSIPRRPVFVEAESRRIGSVALPLALLDTFHQGACVKVLSSREDRAAFLLQDYAHLFDDPEALKAQLQRMIGLHSRERVTGWQRLVDENRRAELAHELIERHYDPAYARSSHQHFTQLPHALQMTFRPNDADVVEQAKALLARLDSHALSVI